METKFLFITRKKSDNNQSRHSKNSGQRASN